MANCKIHHIPLVCPSCVASERGRKGGSVRSKRKRETARQNLTLATPPNLVTYKGKTQDLTAWSKQLKIGRTTLHERLQRGWSVEEAFAKIAKPK